MRSKLRERLSERYGQTYTGVIIPRVRERYGHNIETLKRASPSIENGHNVSARSFVALR